MPGWKILIADGLEGNGQSILRAVAQVDDRSGIEPAELLQTIPGFDALIVRGRTKVNAQVLDAARRLAVVGRAGVGMDNIDLQAAKGRGVVVVNAPAATTQAVAELALGLMLALARSIPRADATMKNGQWLKKDLVGTELNGKSLGIMGMGNIGAVVARLAAALGMTILGYDPLIPNHEIEQRGARAVTLAELYAEADFISLHIPLTAETRGLLDEQAFRQMKSGVRLVCTARGGIVNEAALWAAVQSGKVAGAALDVFAQEPPGASPLWSHPNIIATPHIGAQTQEAQRRVASDIASEVLAALGGQPLRWRVT